MTADDSLTDWYIRFMFALTGVCGVGLATIILQRACQV